MKNYLSARFDKGSDVEVPLVYNISDDGTTVDQAVTDAETAVDELETEKEEEKIAA